jgi:ABC-type nitrate/sulfonate/bicarbonate transport system substrate-binding protein
MMMRPLRFYRHRIAGAAYRAEGTTRGCGQLRAMRNFFARRAIIVALTAFMLLAIIPRPLRAADLETVRVGRAVGDSWLFATLEVGQDAHIWEKVGLKVDIASFKGDGQLQQALTSGAVDFGLGSGPAMGYRAKGVPAIGVAVMTQAPIDLGIVIGANSSIKTIADLKGKKIGVSTAGSLTDWLVHELSRRQGWGPDGIESVPMGTNEVRSAAIVTGQIAGSVTDVGFAYAMEEQGKGKLFTTFGTFVKQFEAHVIFATDDIVAKKPDTVARFLKGWFMTVAYMKTHKAETIKSTMAVLHESMPVVSKIYENDLPGMSLDGAFDAASVAAVAHSLKELGIMETEPDPKTIYTAKFVPVKV